MKEGCTRSQNRKLILQEWLQGFAGTEEARGFRDNFQLFYHFRSGDQARFWLDPDSLQKVSI
jgi:hypothetical protein